MKHFKTLTAAMMALWATLSACSQERDSELKRQASQQDANVKVVRVRDGDLIRFVLVSNGRGYELQCDNPGGLQRLIQATGYPDLLITSTPPLSFDSDAVIRLHIHENPKLTCAPERKFLYKVPLDNTTKYFFVEKKGDTKLFMLGCHALVEAMGFDILTAKLLSPDLIDDTPVFNASDDQDISCYSGNPVGANRVNWEASLEGTRYVRPGTELSMQAFSAKQPNGMPAPLQWTKEGECTWLDSLTLASVLVIRGNIPESFKGYSCQITVTVAAGTTLEEKKILTLKTCDGDRYLTPSGECLAIVRQWGVAKIGQDFDFSTLDFHFRGTQTGWAVGTLSATESAVFKTNDGGRSWTLQQRFPGHYLTSIAFQDEKLGWIVGNNGEVFTSKDGGKTWTPETSPAKQSLSIAKIIREGTLLVIGHLGSMFRSEDAGKTWKEIVLGDSSRRAYSVVFGSPEIGYATSTEGGGGHYQTWKTVDGGKTWTLLTDKPYQNNPRFLWAFDANHVLFAFSNALPSETFDGGLTWVSSGWFVNNDSILQVSFFGNDMGWAIGEKGFYETRNGGKIWNLIREGRFRSMETLDPQHILLMDYDRNFLYPILSN